MPARWPNGRTGAFGPDEQRKELLCLFASGTQLFGIEHLKNGTATTAPAYIC
jgi:hypothetical protein